nr:immunoglobulin heavy chain junction region [Macaca mulatta]MPN84019.1 immunoglobulin heavy chain junction region [Macaca mulatta]MPN84132.1 immunoglobulin heavy chain junction region [Macaca mulatta]MPN84360.1 immunoglobulin heavy chain junction region [Macaca mulatta]MPN84423.1 immunoglobulin heavy chain junction region [Macaca mulatta]
CVRDSYSPWSGGLDYW